MLAAGQSATHFCARCVVYTFHRKRPQPDQFGINVFCLEDLDIAALPVRATGGAAMSVMEFGARPEWPGPREPTSRPDEFDGRHKQKRRLHSETAFCFDRDT
ncbi:hypothetical protein [Bradyrhizobium jicamae]|uniref:hypothetical protein n=1 Tax=Bradyrhizobium jicamae TaxID=280332 RepID=UPI001BA9B5DB|nr:hypothetical protein [Bradyrhizobium jicamae]MBR0935312.1 hypothetical protein [Bradyrhizobium jicamae]